MDIFQFFQSSFRQVLKHSCGHVMGTFTGSPLPYNGVKIIFYAIEGPLRSASCPSLTLSPSVHSMYTMSSSHNLLSMCRKLMQFPLCGCPQLMTLPTNLIHSLICSSSLSFSRKHAWFCLSMFSTYPTLCVHTCIYLYSELITAYYNCLLTLFSHQMNSS